VKFSPGTKLGAYEIVGPLGAGGMGEVYRARDSKLKRDVAIKVLPDVFAGDTERVSRFQREAEVLASLNHPHIAAIHDLAEFEGSQFLILELVEGETLADRLARGPIPVDDSLAIAGQIAEALEAAHEKGIIHRDLKPANIKLTASGNVKVLDFGLAKAFASDQADVNPSNSPTMSFAGTNATVILGTASYMSPEQAKGLAVDKRSDIFSFGSVLYEMLTGRPAFTGETVSEIQARVIEREPDWSRLPKNTPDGIRHLLRRSLEKDRNRRLQTATDARVEIEEGRLTPARRNQADERGISRSRERLAWIVGILVIAATATLAPRYFRTPPEVPESRVDIVTPFTTLPFDFAISPDGRRLVFVASVDGAPRLWLRPLDAAAAQPLPGTEGASIPFWSPDSRSIGFIAGFSGLKRLDLGGGSVQTLTAGAVAASELGVGGGTWNSDGVILYGGFSGVINRISASGGQAAALPKADPALNLQFPQFLPDGRRFLAWSGGTSETAGIYLGSLDSAALTRLTPSDRPGKYAAPGWLFYMRQGTLLARRFDAERGQLAGDPLIVADQVGLDAFSVSQTGIVAFRSATTVRRQLTWFDRSGKAVGTLGEPDDNDLLNPTISPDGRRVAVDRLVQGNRDIWILDGSRMTRLTFDPSVEAAPVWSPDGKWVAFRSSRHGVLDIFRKASSGADADESVIESPDDKTLTDWSRDGRSLLVLTQNPKTGQDLLFMSFDGAPEPKVFLSTNFNETGAHFSPDGQWVAYQSNMSGRPEVYVRPFPEGGGQWQISTTGGNNVRWSPDGKELFYMGADGKLMAVPITVKGATLEPGTPVPLFQTQRAVGVAATARAQYAVAPDGRFLFNVTTGNAPMSPITLILNWKPPVQ
jgi:eukaryotic-like serine/threonine-protein kinase